MTGTDWTCPKCGAEHSFCECSECRDSIRRHPALGEYSVCLECNAEVRCVGTPRLLTEEEVAALPAIVLQTFDLLRRRRAR